MADRETQGYPIEKVKSGWGESTAWQETVSCEREDIAEGSDMDHNHNQKQHNTFWWSRHKTKRTKDPLRLDKREAYVNVVVSGLPIVCCISCLLRFFEWLRRTKRKRDFALIEIE